jgi:hypothetical protein
MPRRQPQRRRGQCDASQSFGRRCVAVRSFVEWDVNRSDGESQKNESRGLRPLAPPHHIPSRELYRAPLTLLHSSRAADTTSMSYHRSGAGLMEGLRTGRRG